jgi:glyoxylase-like metal-dependent hydrolase (beta-lactamase superfamily II)
LITLASGLSYLDLRFLGVSGVIATAVIQGADGIALVDPGPSTTLGVLKAELERAGVLLRDLRALLLTHIHLDHAGATGTLVHELPGLRVYVHQRGAPHLVNPEKLIASAERLYGGDMDRLWGEVRPVPEHALIALQGGERMSAGGRDFEVAYTPGHASHHVSYFNAETGVAFVGDTAGIRRTPGGFVLPPTPPPDIDLEQWRDSLERIGRWRADTLFVTHFGPHGAPAVHLSELAEHLEWTAGLVRTSLTRDGTDDDRAAWFTGEIRRELRRRTSEADARAYEVAGRFDLNWRGLARYWRKRNAETE